MDLERMQVVWDEQKQRRVFALDLEALHESIRRRGRRIASGIELMQVSLIVICLAMVPILASKPLLKGSSPTLYVSAAVVLAVALYLIVERLRYRARQRQFAPNVLGDLDRAIAQVDYHIRRIRTFPIWFCAPFFATVVINLVAKVGKGPWWAWLIVFAAFPLSIYVTRLELRCVHLRRKQELEALRAMLTDAS